MNRTRSFPFVFLSSGRRRAVVAKPRYDMCSREALRYPELKDRIELNKIRDHFICLYSICIHSNQLIVFVRSSVLVNIESVGALPPEQLFVDAIKLLMSKCDRLLREIDGNVNN